MIVLKKTLNALQDRHAELVGKYELLLNRSSEVCDLVTRNEIKHQFFLEWLEKNAGNNHETLDKYKEIMGV